MLEKLHSVGFVYNDLKNDNICIGNHNEQNPKLLKLIDFGLCTKFLDSNGNHIKMKNVNFKGNVMFGSLHAMNFNTSSRRDDLISLFYYLVYLSDEYEYCFNLDYD